MEGFFDEIVNSSSFASVWYWVVFALLWTRATHCTLGVPYEDLQNARSFGGQYATDFRIQIQINVRKTLAVYEQHSMVLTVFLSFLLGTVFTLGFHFYIQIMQATFLLMMSQTMVSVLSIHLAKRIRNQKYVGDKLYSAYLLHRRTKQCLGAVSIFFAAFLGVSQTLSLPLAFSF